MSAKKDLTGKIFGELTVVKESSLRDKISKNVKWECLCSCGKTTVVRGAHLNFGDVTSCGHLIVKTGELVAINFKRPPIVNGKLSREGVSYINLIARCYTKSCTNYFNYGGRGIKVCERWLGPEGFDHFLEDMGERPEGTSIDRIDVDGNYEPTNCRWATNREQNLNKRINKKAA